MRRISRLAICFLGISSAAFADPVTIFGVPMGEAFDLPQCAEEHPITVAANCWTYEFDPGLMPQSMNMRTLHFANPPALGHDITAFVDDGIVDIITIETASLDAQDSIMAQLKQKFGKPTHFAKVSAQNRMGAKFVADRAEWSTPQIFVRYDADASDGGMHEGTLDHGWIAIETQKKHIESEKAHDEYLKKQQQL